jgi:hypothetical protein
MPSAVRATIQEARVSTEIGRCAARPATVEAVISPGQNPEWPEAGPMTATP